MSRCLVVLIASVIMNFTLLGQRDSIALSANTRLNDGVFLTYQDLRYNRPILKEEIISKFEKDQLEFIGKTMFEESFSFKRNDSVITLPSKSAWGYVQNNTFYVNYNEEFYRIPVFGSISYLIAHVNVLNTGFYDPRFGTSTSASNTRELREFLINFYDGKVIEFTMDQFEILISRDQALYDEFNKLSRRKRKEQLYTFIRKYNERHPVYFLKT